MLRFCRTAIAVLLWLAFCQPGGFAQAKRQYTLREIRFTNTHAITHTDFLRRQIPLKDGHTFDPARLSTGLDRIRYLYQEMGYLLVACTPEVIRDDEQRSISVVVSLDEGKPFFIKSISVIGLNGRDVDEELAGYSLQRGKIYNRRLAELFFTRNAPRRIAHVLSDSRIQLATNASEGTVDVTFDFREAQDR